MTIETNFWVLIFSFGSRANNLRFSLLEQDRIRLLGRLYKLLTSSSVAPADGSSLQPVFLVLQMLTVAYSPVDSADDVRLTPGY